ncbi:hypothetical protein RHSP_31530 [Rhizobium freirei PRF 81]|uniref:Uncharacterized protein n=1 Tax=Rhizobium freirei PRF 81 TaxID=363754 RepID=N6UYT8_9HYPH|nr:hypothetical protein [Rhizobium freirei]ENN86840.1 hypothetical protein RHSP_31530 [Rhizobium freirei PRF 81]
MDFSARNIIASALAGAVAVIPNEVVLKAADGVGIPTAHGGLLALTKVLLSELADMIGLLQTCPFNPAQPVGSGAGRRCQCRVSNWPTASRL